MHNISNFIIVDDERISTMLCEISIRNTFPNPIIYKFANPVDALLHLGKEYNDSSIIQPTILFLDIYMPVIDGWEFLHCFSRFDERIKSQVSIIVLSSSNEPADKQRALTNLYVTDYVVKP